MIKTPLIIYTDGSCSNRKGFKNYGVGGAGIVMRYGEHSKDIAVGSFKHTTSVRMEMMAICVALESVQYSGHNNPFDIALHTDNQMCSNGVNKGWYYNWVNTGTIDGRPNADLWKRMFDVYEKLGGRKRVTIKWVKGHSGHPLNELADKLANEGRAKGVVIPDLPTPIDGPPPQNENYEQMLERVELEDEEE